MGLLDTVQNLVNTAFDAIGDLKETVSYTHQGKSSTYDTATGTVYDDPASFTVQVRAIFTNLRKAEEELPSQLIEVALVGDQVVLIPGVDLGVEPTTGDRIIRLDETWVVKGFVRDPAKGLWKILVTRVGGGADDELVFHE